MGFQFSLQAVLQFRENAERQEEIKLQQLFAELVQAEDEAEQLSSHIGEASSRRNRLLAESSAAFHLQALDGEIRQARLRQEELKVHISLLEQKRAEQLREYHQKRTARSVLDEMHKQQRHAFDKGQSAQEQKRLDDIFATRVQRD